eukprot:GAHX01002242.1.p1 GENE.GAHX01002242.1~~GAHX01002242.1.p1  ORF type:complete len:196 (-),score=30.25 GAHX01002242.1:33-620(-)
MKMKIQFLINIIISHLLLKELPEKRIIACVKRNHHKKEVSQLMLTTLQPEVFLLTYILLLKRFIFIEFDDAGFKLNKIHEYFVHKEHKGSFVHNKKVFEEIKAHGVCLYSLKYRESLVFKVPLVNYRVKLSNLRCVNNLRHFLDRKDSIKYRRRAEYMDDLIIETIPFYKEKIECDFLKGEENILWAEKTMLLGS